MEINVKRLCALKEYEGSFEYDYDPPADLCLIPMCRINGGVKVSGKYVLYDDDSVGVTLTVRYKISGQCSYCLENAEKDISYTAEILYLTEREDDNYIYDGVKIDLKSAVNDAILISQPNILLCKEDCTGIDITNK